MKKKFARKKPAHKRWFTYFLALIVGAPVVALTLFLTNFDLNAYRPQIAEALTTQLGREVKLDGPLKWGLSMRHGFDVSVAGLNVANPSWASRPMMAQISKAEIVVSLWYLLQKQLKIVAVEIAGADILLESNAAGQKNWDVSQTELTESAPSDCAKKDCAQPTQAVTVRLGSVFIGDSRLVLLGKDKKATIIVARRLDLKAFGRQTILSFEGDVGGSPLGFELTGDEFERLLVAKWPFTAKLMFGNLTLESRGILNSPGKEIVVEALNLKADETNLSAHLTLAYGGDRPVLRGAVTGERFAFADLSLPETSEKTGKKSAGVSKEEKVLFSRAPIHFDGLKALDAKLDMALTEMPVGAVVFKQVQTKLDLANGRLLLSPFSAQVADGKAEGQLKMDASVTPPQGSALLKARQVDLSEIINYTGLESFVVGKGDADLDVTTYGNSPHDFASNMNGQIGLVVSGGKLSESVMSKFAGNVLEVLSAGMGQVLNLSLNCMVTRFKIVNGLMRSDGLLGDSPQMSVMGSGNVNLREETIDMLLRTRNKIVNAAVVSPDVRIGGTLANPDFSLDAIVGARKLTEVLTGEEGTTLGSVLEGSSVPEVTGPPGQNACLYTLDHATAAETKPTTSSPLPTALVPGGGGLNDAVGKMRDKLKGVGGKLFNELNNIMSTSGSGVLGN